MWGLIANAPGVVNEPSGAGCAPRRTVPAPPFGCRKKAAIVDDFSRSDGGRRRPPRADRQAPRGRSIMSRRPRPPGAGRVPEGRVTELLQIELPARRRRGAAATSAPRGPLKPLARRVGRAIEDFRLIEDGDRILCAMSGGKDSYAMLHLLDYLRRRAPVRFELVAITVDQGYRGFRADVLAQ